MEEAGQKMLITIPRGGSIDDICRKLGSVGVTKFTIVLSDHAGANGAQPKSIGKLAVVPAGPFKTAVEIICDLMKRNGGQDVWHVDAFKREMRNFRKRDGSKFSPASATAAIWHISHNGYADRVALAEYRLTALGISTASEQIANAINKAKR